MTKYLLLRLWQSQIWTTLSKKRDYPNFLYAAVYKIRKYLHQSTVSTEHLIRFFQGTPSPPKASPHFNLFPSLSFSISIFLVVPISFPQCCTAAMMRVLFILATVVVLGQALDPPPHPPDPTKPAETNTETLTKSMKEINEELDEIWSIGQYAYITLLFRLMHMLLPIYPRIKSCSHSNIF